MICGALSTLNEDAFEDVSAQNPNSSSGNNGSTGELIIQQNYLAPITEEHIGSPTSSRSFESFFDNNNVNNNSNNRVDESTIIIMPNYSNIDDTRL
jgi:hypothetical protein